MMEGCPHFADPAPHLDYANEFLVKWRDTQTGHTLFLGQLASSARRCGELSMWFADDETNQKCMIGFSLPLKMRAATKKRRDVHLVLPAKSFASPGNLFSLDVVMTQDDPEAEQEFQKAGLGASKLLRLSFALQEQGYASMPTEPFKHPLPSNSRGLLLSLRSLSRSTNFDVYLPYLESAKDLLEGFATKPRSLPVSSPLIDYVKTYSGRSWGVEEWNVYGIEDNEAMPNAWNPVIDDNPPPYEEAIREKQTSQTKCIETALGYRSDPKPDDLHQHLKFLVDQEQARLHSGNGDAGSIPDTASWSGSDHAEAQNTLTKRKADDLSLDSEQPHKCRPSEKPSGRYQSFTCGSEEQSRPFKLEKNAIYSTEDEVFISKRSLLNGGPNSKLFSEAQYRCFTITLNWFMKIWRERADAYVVFLPELKELAKLASEADSAKPETLKEFEDFRVASMHLFCQDDRPRKQTAFRHDLPVDEKLRLLHRFVYRPDAELAPGRDCNILDDLLALHEVAKACDARKETCGELGFSFHAQMSACILLVLYGSAHGNE